MIQVFSCSEPTKSCSKLKTNLAAQWENKIKFHVLSLLSLCEKIALQIFHEHHLHIFEIFRSLGKVDELFHMPLIKALCDREHETGVSSSVQK